MARAGIYPNLPEADYHGDPDSLSVSGMKLLLQAPALYRYRRDHPEHKDVFDFGSAAHRKVLGVGAEIVKVDADDWRGKAAREARTEARAEGKVALLAKDVERVDAMALALSHDKLAMRLLSDGQPEVSAFWHDEEWGVTRRARFDWSASNIITDYKTCASAQPGRLPKVVCDFGYDMQAANYIDVATGCDLDPIAFAFVFQEKEPPHLVTVAEVDGEFLARGQRRVERALEIYRDCREADLWPGYTPTGEFVTLTPPAWAYRDEF
jgi:PDDEXK-like uncharacterized protein DUF3799